MAQTSADMPSTKKHSGASSRFLDALGGFSGVTFLSHVNPDPDSLGSMLGLSHLVQSKLGLPTQLTRDGYIGRAENRTMVATLGLKLVPIEDVIWTPEVAVVMVDSQPDTGRHTIPEDVPIHAVIDHHETPGKVRDVSFVDVRRDVGATCTLVTSYLVDEKVTLPPRVATGLYYGIESELTGYPREATRLDDSALLCLFPLASKDDLARIRHARLPQSYFETLLSALQNSFIYDKLIVSWADDLPQPELCAEIAEFLIRFEEVDWSLCAGTYEDQLILSLRSCSARGRAGHVLQEVVGDLGRAGGHDRRAGGSIPLASTSDFAIEQLRSQLRKRLLETLRIDDQRGQRLVSRKEILQGLQT